MKKQKIKSKKSAQDIQDEIFRKMSAERKIKLTSDFSMFILELNKIGNYGRFSKVINENRRDFK
ncbi:MAG: hypothetical protein NTX55_00430 [Candidatus Parcubacteria bacterium]|nr:hypothetical protein [Candidatus Parcubacteria bacterium]